MDEEWEDNGEPDQEYLDLLLRAQQAKTPPVYSREVLFMWSNVHECQWCTGTYEELQAERPHNWVSLMCSSWEGDDPTGLILSSKTLEHEQEG